MNILLDHEAFNRIYVYMKLDLKEIENGTIYDDYRIISKFLLMRFVDCSEKGLLSAKCNMDFFYAACLTYVEGKLFPNSNVNIDELCNIHCQFKTHMKSFKNFICLFDAEHKKANTLLI